MDNLFYQSRVGLGTWWLLKTPIAILDCAAHWVYVTNVPSLEPAALQSFLYVHLWETSFPVLGVIEILL